MKRVPYGGVVVGSIPTNHKLEQVYIVNDLITLGKKLSYITFVRPTLKQSVVSTAVELR